jgi:hypothetical protein
MSSKERHDDDSGFGGRRSPPYLLLSRDLLLLFPRVGLDFLALDETR